MDMERIYRTRRERLQSAALARFELRGLRKRLADLLDRDPNYISRLLSDPSKPGHKRIGEELARHAEEVLGKPMYWLDGHEDVSSQWPFLRVTPDRLERLSPHEIDRLETVLETTLTLLENEKPSVSKQKSRA